MSRKAPEVYLSQRLRVVLELRARAPSTSQQLAERIRIVLGSANGELNRETAEVLGIDPQRVSRWRRRWFGIQDRLQEAESKGATDKELEALAAATLSDLYRAGVTPKFTPEQVVQIIAVACEDPMDSGIPVSHWTAKEVAAEAVKRGIVKSISVRQVGRFLKGGGSKTSQEPVLADVQRQAGRSRTLRTRRTKHLRDVSRGARAA